MNEPQFHAPIEEHLDSFQFCLSVMAESINIRVKDFCLNIHFYFPEVKTRGGITVLYGKSMFNFIMKCPSVFHSVCTISTSNIRKFQVFCPLASPCIISNFYLRHSNNYVVLAHSGFNLHFSNGK